MTTLLPEKNPPGTCRSHNKTENYCKEVNDKRGQGTDFYNINNSCALKRSNCSWKQDEKRSG